MNEHLPLILQELKLLNGRINALDNRFDSMNTGLGGLFS